VNTARGRPRADRGSVVAEVLVRRAACPGVRAATRSGHRPAPRSQHRASPLQRRAIGQMHPVVVLRSGSPVARAAGIIPPRGPGERPSARQGWLGLVECKPQEGERRASGDRGLPELAAGAGVSARWWLRDTSPLMSGTPRGWLRPAAGHPHPVQPALVRTAARGLRIPADELDGGPRVHSGTRAAIRRVPRTPRVSVRHHRHRSTAGGARDNPAVPAGHLRR
jgi:hypothetical protein